VVGENGTGKSTLIKGLLKLKAPSSGLIECCNGLNSNEIGYLPQQNAAQKDFPASVFEVVLSGRLNRRRFSPFYSKADKVEAMQALQLLGIEELKRACYRELSGGQQQRVLLARALCATKKLLLLDEPVTGLDPVMTVGFYRLIRQLNRKQNISVVMVSHDIHGVVDQADHILHLGNTQLFFGPTAEYIKSDLGRRFVGGELA
jgi:zinc transport system ATP-binding protein